MTMRSGVMPNSSREGRMPDNAIYYHLAYIVAIAVYVLYAISIRRRINRLSGPK